MLDFFTVATRSKKPGYVEVYPKFQVKPTEDLMLRGGDFYAIWVEDRGLWSTNEYDAVQLIDRELTRYAEEHKGELDGNVKISYMRDAESGTIDAWHKFCQKQMRETYHVLDEKLLFSNDGTNKKDYASKRLSYPLEPGDCPAYEKIISTLYSEEERHKLEWAIGAIVTGESRTLQKFLVLYGGPGTGKSTILNIIQDLFDGYHTVFDAKALGSANAQFALEPFKDNPLVAIQHDGDLSKIEDNTRLNSVVSHEWMTINEKHKAQYKNRFICFLFMGTNKPVKITDGKSGILRRLIDVSPSGNKIPILEYKKLMKQVKFELGPIAYHCKEVFLSDPGRYDEYIPTSMMSQSNDFYNFMIDSYSIFKREDGTTLKAAWEMYKNYVEEAKVPYSLSKMHFRAELMNYFREFSERFTNDDGDRLRSYYHGFRTEKFQDDDNEPVRVEEAASDDIEEKKTKELEIPDWLKMEVQESIFDKECANCLAQKASSKETPSRKWDDVKSTLSKLDTSKLHYVKVPDNHIVIDFDIRDESGQKSFQKNLEAAEKWPPTYAELSKSGEGIHLHYIYSGDVTKLSRIYDYEIEVKVFTGKSSLRRMLTKCNNLPFATISSGLPLKGDDKNLAANWEGIKNEKMLRTMIKRNLNKEYHPNTKPSIDYIAKLLDDAYNSGIGYDVSDMKNEIFAFAAGSTHQADYCIKLTNKMKFKSEEAGPSAEAEKDELVFYDCEVFPNLFLVNWKVAGLGKPIVRMINPKPKDIEALMRFKLVGFNVRRYDNHMLYACLMGYDNEQLYNLSQKIVNAKKGSVGTFFGEAYNISYTDIYDFASAGNKKSLKKLEIEMSGISREELAKKGFNETEIDLIKAGTRHKELGLPWDQPVPKERWEEVAAYCDNDVLATESAFHYLKADWTARQILADLAELSVNDTTNSLTTRIIFGNNRKPQSEFCYRDMSKPVLELDPEVEKFLREACPVMMSKRHGEARSLLPYFPGYKYEYGVSTYRGTEVGEGGNVYAEPGMYSNVALLDVSSMHPHSAIAECVFGPRFTRAFRDIVEGRVDIKHEAWDVVNKILDGKLKPYIQKVINGEMTSGELADALKTAINSVYGLTAAKFENPFRDIRNIDNIVAKRGALFMEDLKYEVQKRGFTVGHIKTDSIKVPNATPEIIKFIMDFGQDYGYTFEHEATYDRMCLVNDAVYIAKYATVEHCYELYGKEYVDSDSSVCKKNKKKSGKWDATGAQFAVPYVFKKLFSKEQITFDDMCETKSVSSALYLDMNEGLTADDHDYHFVGKVGLFCPIKPGRGGGELVRAGTDKDGNLKYSSATGAKDFRWLETETVRLLNKEKDVDRSYYDKLVDAAIDTISHYGDFERFVADEPYVAPSIEGNDFPPDEDAPWYTDDELAAIKAAEEEGLPYYITSDLAQELDEHQISDAFNKR